VPEGFNSRAHGRERGGKIMRDELSRDAKHLVVKARKVPIPPRIGSAPPSVDAPIYLYDQAQ